MFFINNIQDVEGYFIRLKKTLKIIAMTLYHQQYSYSFFESGEI